MTKYEVDVIVRISVVEEVEVLEKDIQDFGCGHFTSEEWLGDVAAMKALREIRKSDWWQDSLNNAPGATFEIGRPRKVE